MNEIEISKFKIEIKKYKKYKAIQANLKERIDLLLYEMENVKGISYDDVSINTDEATKEEYRLFKIEEYNDMLQTYQYLQNKIDYIEDILNRMNEEDRELFLMKYRDGISFYALGKMMYMSKSGIVYHFDNILKSIEL